VAFALLGTILGAVIGLIAALLRRSRPGLWMANWWDAARRPIRFPRKSISTPTTITAPRPGFLRRRWPWPVGAPVLFVLTAAFASGAYLGRLVDRRLADAVAAADRDDPFWRLDDLMAHREPVPDAAKSAIVVAEALSSLLDRPKRQRRTRRVRPEDIPKRGPRRLWHIRLGQIFAPTAPIRSHATPPASSSALTGPSRTP